MPKLTEVIRSILFSLVVVCLVLAVTSLLQRCSPQPAQVVVDQLAEVVNDQSTKIELVEESGQLQVGVIVDNVKKEKEIKKDVVKRIEKSEKKVIEIKEDPVLTQLEKDIAITDAMIDDLQESYCSIQGVVCPVES